MTLARVQGIYRLNPGLSQALRVLGGIVMLSLAACSTVSSRGPGPAEIEQQPAHEYFELQGRLAVKHGSDGFSAAFTWVQQGPEYSIRLWGPLGQGRTLIKGDASNIEITTPDGVTHSDDHPQRLMQHWLGWSVPLDVFRYWIQGHSVPQLMAGDVNIQKVDSGTFEQLGWQINPSRYRVVEGGVMPMKTIAVSEDFKITLIIRKARLGKAAGSLDSSVSRYQNSRLPRSGSLYMVDLKTIFEGGFHLVPNAVIVGT